MLELTLVLVRREQGLQFLLHALEGIRQRLEVDLVFTRDGFQAGQPFLDPVAACRVGLERGCVALQGTGGFGELNPGRFQQLGDSRQGLVVFHQRVDLAGGLGKHRTGIAAFVIGEDRQRSCRAFCQADAMLEFLLLGPEFGRLRGIGCQSLELLDLEAQQVES